MTVVKVEALGFGGLNHPDAAYQAGNFAIYPSTAALAPPLTHRHWLKSVSMEFS